jgi:putative flippase GtrA
MKLAHQVERNLLNPSEPLPGARGERLMFFRFLVVGALAYAVNQVVLFLIYDADLIPGLPEKDASTNLWLFTYPDTLLLIAAVVGVQASVVFKFALNELWIFHHRARSNWIGSRFLQFNVSCIFTSVIVVAVINAVTLLFDISPYISASLGVLASFMINWLLSNRLIWRHRRQEQRVPSHG